MGVAQGHVALVGDVPLEVLDVPAAETLSEPEVAAQLAATGALADMALGRPAAAAHGFSKVGTSLGSAFDDVVTSVDIARYGTLCGLAAHDRAWLRTHLLGSSTFALHLEALPEVCLPICRMTVRNL